MEAHTLQERVTNLEMQTRARSLVAYAEGILVERYALANANAAFDLMRSASQRTNIKLHQVAAALTHTAPPAPGARTWFLGRADQSPPPLDALGGGSVDARNQGEVLSAALRRVLEITGGYAGNVQLVEAGVLRLENHQGHSEAFTDYFAFVEDGTSCSRAAANKKQVTVRDIARTEVFSDETRQFLLDSGSRAAHSLPLPSPDGTVRGVLSSHHDRPLDSLSQEQLDALHQVGILIGAWLQWHQNTVVLDALEHLHHAAITPPGNPPPR
ncbi:ANTAR domain-containing protein [Streptomyces sp. T-3]|nr:ANTAR domain-containing protein [Streptomyces sp. T-3]